MMIRRITRQFPEWARSDHPVLRQEIGQRDGMRWQTRYARALLIVVGAAVLIMVGVGAATGIFTRAAGQNLSESVHTVLYFPLLILQVILRIIAFSWTSGTIADHARRGTWDQMRATPTGAELTLRARWFSLYYRLRGLFGVIIALRLLLIGLLLYDLTSHQGAILSILTLGIIPSVTIPGAIVLLAFVMTAGVLLPITGAGFDAALGTLVSVFTQGRTAATLVQALYIFFRVGVTVALLIMADAFLNGAYGTLDRGGWLILFGLGAVGDGGLAFLYLGRMGEVWGLVPYGVFMGVALVIFALGQVAVTDILIKWAAKIAQARG